MTAAYLLALLAVPPLAAGFVFVLLVLQHRLRRRARRP